MATERTRHSAPPESLRAGRFSWLPDAPTLLQPEPPSPGSLRAGRRKSSPATAFSMLTSTPSTHPRVKPPYPPRLIRTLARDGDSPIHRRSTGKSLPMAVGGSVAAISGTALMIAVTNVFELGPGHARVAYVRIRKISNSLADSGDHPVSRRTIRSKHDLWRAPEPSAIRNEAVYPNRLTPSRVVEPTVCRGTRFLHDDPAVGSDNSPPPHRTGGKDADDRSIARPHWRQQSRA
jgi:hypothetical protein